MFCANCGKELPDDSQFCLKCGHALTGVVAPTPIQPVRKKSHLGVWILLPLLAVVLVWFSIEASNDGVSGPSASSTGVTGLLHLARTQVIANGATTVNADSYTYYRFEVPTGATGITVNGHFAASGGIGNDIETFILDHDSFVNFQNGHTATTFYNSGKVTDDAISARLPSGGIYYLVFNNRFSLITPKAVRVNAILQYTD